MDNYISIQPFNVNTVIADSLQSLSTDLFAVIGTVAPIAFGIAAAVIGINFGIRFIRRVVS